ncbi:hypothetical protein [uncultured Jatrophihabitans sp.]|uniref:hypothetical protein n=1 Tax=uncultured Jatrophihabitans sp. TaxID=1610747 RepID=UPI0035CBAAEB
MAEFNKDLWVGIVTAAPVLLVVFSESLTELLSANDRVGPDGRTGKSLWISIWVYATPVGGGVLTLWAAITLLIRSDAPANDIAGVAGLGALLVGSVSGAVELRWLQRKIEERAAGRVTPPGLTGSTGADEAFRQLILGVLEALRAENVSLAADPPARQPPAARDRPGTTSSSTARA